MGATRSEQNSCSFLVWAPRVQNVDVHILEPNERMAPMQPCDKGYFRADLPNVPAGTLYRYRLNGGRSTLIPASAFQPQGVHGPSQVIENHFEWTDAGWRGPSLREYVLYELHVGTFTPEGTFDAIIPRIAELKALGVTALEIMPVAQFPGDRNWGYDGVYPFAVQNSYGGPDGSEALGKCLPRAGNGRGARRGLQPPRPGRELRGRIWILFHRCVQNALGRGAEFRTGIQR